MKRRNLILSILLAAQLLLVIFIYNTGNKEQKEAITLTDFEPANVVSLEIADSYGSSTNLVKKDGAWLIDPPEDYPADSGRIESALKKLSDIRSDRLVTTSRGSQGRLRVSDEKFNRRITISESDGKKHQIYLGNSQGKGVYARLGGSDEVVFANGLSSWEFATSPRSWWKTDIVDIATESMNRVTITNSHGTIKLLRNKKGMWTDDSGKILDQDKVKRLLLSLKNTRLSQYLKKDTDKKLDKVEASIRIVPAKGKEIVIEIGPEEEKEHIVRTNLSEHLLKVRSSELKQILNADINEIEAAKKTPPPEKSSSNATASAVSPAAGAEIAAANATSGR